MVAPYASEDVRIETEGNVVSESYIRMTLEVMERFQVKAAQAGDTLTVRCGQCYKPATFKVEPDFSAASVFLCAAMTTGGTVRVGLDPENSIQGDAGIIPMLSRMGGTVERTPGELVFSGVQSRNYQGVTLDMRSTPDLVPALVSVLLFAETPSHLLGVGHLRFKESDRLDVLAAELRKTGADITVREDSIEICPVPLHGATLNPHSDHRLAMSFAVVGLRVPGIRIDNPGCVRKSFPGFWTEFGKMESHVAQSRGSNEG
jgi:3-phosphoshikimate 1-carboxyvinyltransferase